jgi:hypothetical protein
MRSTTAILTLGGPKESSIGFEIDRIEEEARGRSEASGLQG